MLPVTRGQHMGLLDRLMGRPRRETTPQTSAVRITLLAGDDDLEVVGESNYQDALWRICGARRGDRVRHPINGVLVPEPLNPHDANAVAVYVDGHLIGYLDRGTAVQYVGGVHSLMARHGSHVGLRGHVVGGGRRDHGLGFLGVWLEHDPADFGAARASRSGGRPVAEGTAMRTGFSEAWLTDADDDSYDLSWYNELPDGDRAAIAMLRDLLATDPDPIDRHFQFAELESRLYRCRDLYASALDEFDEACRRHDAEMESICLAQNIRQGLRTNGLAAAPVLAGTDDSAGSEPLAMTGGAVATNSRTLASITLKSDSPCRIGALTARRMINGRASAGRSFGFRHSAPPASTGRIGAARSASSRWISRGTSSSMQS